MPYESGEHRNDLSSSWLLWYVELSAHHVACWSIYCYCFLVLRIEELGIDRDGGSVCFGQLLGMCDHVSLTLGEMSTSTRDLLMESYLLWRQINTFICIIHMYHHVASASLQVGRVMPCTSQCRTAQWMTHYPTWCVGLRRIVLCCWGSAKKGTSCSKSSAGGSAWGWEEAVSPPRGEKEKSSGQSGWLIENDEEPAVGHIQVHIHLRAHTKAISTVYRWTECKWSTTYGMCTVDLTSCKCTIVNNSLKTLNATIQFPFREVVEETCI